VIRALLPLLCLLAAVADAQQKKDLSPEILLKTSREPLLRESAAQVLGVRGSPGALRLLTQCLASDENKWVRARCAESLGLIGDAQAVPVLETAMAKEKDQRVRRLMAQALFHLGHKSGVRELMWQLKAGTNYSRAEAMQFFVAKTGVPLGQEIAAWWAYWDAQGYALLATRPKGSPAVLELRGLTSPSNDPSREKLPQSPSLYSQTSQSWRVIPTTVLTFPPSLSPLGRNALLIYEKHHGSIPDGTFLLLRPRWKEALTYLSKLPAGSPQKKPVAAEIAKYGPYLTIEAARYLLLRAPKCIGVGIDTRSLNAQSNVAQPQARELLVDSKRIVLESLDDTDRLPLNVRLLLFDPEPMNKAQPHRAQVLAILP
jgi:kynurenine formamidase